MDNGACTFCGSTDGELVELAYTVGDLPQLHYCYLCAACHVRWTLAGSEARRPNAEAASTAAGPTEPERTGGTPALPNGITRTCRWCEHWLPDAAGFQQATAVVCTIKNRRTQDVDSCEHWLCYDAADTAVGPTGEGGA